MRHKERTRATRRPETGAEKELIMLDQIINAIPADPTYAEIEEVVGDSINATTDYAELLREMLGRGMSYDFEYKLVELIVDGLKEVNDEYERELFC